MQLKMRIKSLKKSTFFYPTSKLIFFQISGYIKKETKIGGTLSSQFTNLSSDPIQLLDCITLKLCYIKQMDSVNERQFQSIANINESLNDTFDTKQILLNEGSSNQSIKQCVNVNHQIVKKRKKLNKIL